MDGREDAAVKEKKILHLTLYRRWFDLVASGKKKIEYRRACDHWRRLIFNKNGWPKKFDEIHFRNGYGADRPLVVTEFAFAMVTHADSCSCDHGEEIEGLVIVIGIGNNIRSENYHG